LSAGRHPSNMHKLMNFLFKVAYTYDISILMMFAHRIPKVSSSLGIRCAEV
jgi:hypothetical protein